MRNLIFGLLMIIASTIGMQGTEMEQEINKDITVKKLSEGVWLHVSYKELESYGRVPANGLIVLDGTNAAMIDTPWDDEQTAILIDWVKKELGAQLKIVIPTHYHADCMGGLNEAHKRGADSYAFEKTATIAREKGLPIPKNTFDTLKIVKVGTLDLELFYPGGGHTLDTCTVWLPKQKILFAGDLARNINAENLGNIKEADLKAWSDSIKKLLQCYQEAKMVIPGHGEYGGLDLLTHTAKLLEK